MKAGVIGQEILSFLHLEIGNYIRTQQGSCKIYPASFAVKLFDDGKTIVEPDISVICTPDKLTKHGCTGAPDWIIEIVSPSTASNDYVRKLNLYLDAGVKEYWIVDPDKQSIYVYHLEQTKFETTAHSFQDKIKVNIYQDLWIDFKPFSAMV